MNVGPEVGHVEGVRRQVARGVPRRGVEHRLLEMLREQASQLVVPHRVDEIADHAAGKPSLDVQELAEQQDEQVARV